MNSKVYVQCSEGRGREKGWNASTSSADALCEGTLERFRQANLFLAQSPCHLLTYLRGKLNFKLATEILPLELLILSHVRRDHPPDLLMAQQQAEAEIVDASVVADDGQVLHLGGEEAADEILWDSAEAESPDDQLGAVGDIADGLVGIGAKFGGKMRGGGRELLGGGED